MEVFISNKRTVSTDELFPFFDEMDLDLSVGKTVDVVHLYSKIPSEFMLEFSDQRKFNKIFREYLYHKNKRFLFKPIRFSGQLRKGFEITQ